LEKVQRSEAKTFSQVKLFGIGEGKTTSKAINNHQVIKLGSQDGLVDYAPDNHPSEPG